MTTLLRIVHIVIQQNAGYLLTSIIGLIFVLIKTMTVSVQHAILTIFIQSILVTPAMSIQRKKLSVNMLKKGYQT